MSTAKTQLDRELERLIVGTNDQRRRAGQALYHFYRTLIFWQNKGHAFHDSVRAWSAGGASIFDSIASTLIDLEVPPECDTRLRRFMHGVLERLAEDLARGDHTRTSFLRWIEGRFPELTAMMKEEAGDSKIYDVDLAVDLTQLFTICAGADAGEMPSMLRTGANRIRPD